MKKRVLIATVIACLAVGSVALAKCASVDNIHDHMKDSQEVTDNGNNRYSASFACMFDAELTLSPDITASSLEQANNYVGQAFANLEKATESTEFCTYQTHYIDADGESHSVAAKIKKRG